MLGPLLRSPHLGWIEKTASVIELTMPTMTSLIFAYLLLSCLTYSSLRDVLERREYVLAFVIGFCQSIATLAARDAGCESLPPVHAPLAVRTEFSLPTLLRDVEAGSGPQGWSGEVGTNALKSAVKIVRFPRRPPIRIARNR